MNVPGVGKVSLSGDVIKANAMVDITAANAGSFGF
jgi:hypothetical protein